MKRIVMMGLVSMLCGAGIGAGDQGGQPPAASDDPRFEFLKQLAGTWVSGPGDTEMPEGLFEFRVTAGGHAVEERIVIFLASGP